MSLLPHISKIFKRLIGKLINSYIENKLSIFITGFRKSRGTQRSLVTMLEKWKHSLEKRRIC